MIGEGGVYDWYVECVIGEGVVGKGGVQFVWSVIDDGGG